MRTDIKPDLDKIPALSWLRRLGIAGFLFFLAKGLLWLIIPVLTAYFAID